MIYAGMATITGREKECDLACESLQNQVDSLILVKNYDMGDAGKFLNVQEREGYYFSTDDDIIYPSNYVEHLIAKIDQYDRRCIITCHGKILNQGRVSSYYARRNRMKQFHCNADQSNDEFCTVGGSGVMAFHTDTLNLSINDFKWPNMADIWLSLQAQRQRVPIVVIAHKKGWLGIQQVSNTIHQRYYRDDRKQTEIYNSMDWKLLVYKKPPIGRPEA